MLLADGQIEPPPALVEDPADDLAAAVAAALAAFCGCEHRILPSWPRWYRNNVVPATVRHARARDMWLSLPQADRARVALVAGPGSSHLAGAVGVDAVVVVPSRMTPEPFWPSVLVGGEFDGVPRRGGATPAIEAAARAALGGVRAVRTTDPAVVVRYAGRALATQDDVSERVRRRVAKDVRRHRAAEPGRRHWLDEVVLETLRRADAGA